MENFFEKMTGNFDKLTDLPDTRGQGMVVADFQSHAFTLPAGE
jgi:hypothetical protein